MGGEPLSPPARRTAPGRTVPPAQRTAPGRTVPSHTGLIFFSYIVVFLHQCSLFLRSLVDERDVGLINFNEQDPRRDVGGKNQLFSIDQSVNESVDLKS